VAALDGFAILAASTEGASDYAPIPVAAGGPPGPRPGSVYQMNGVGQAWALLAQAVEAYVSENVDEVITELGNAYVDGNRGRFVDPVEALSHMMGVGDGERDRVSFRPQPVRTHLIITGQGSQLRPLKRRLAEVVHQAGLGEILTEDALRPSANRAGNAPVGPTVRPKGWGPIRWLKSMVEDHDGGVAADPREHRAVALNAMNLKDGCARGALAWYSSNPIMLNRDWIHGQLVIQTINGIEFPVDMDELNGKRRLSIGPEQLGLSHDALNVYYLPAKGLNIERHSSQRAALMDTLDACDRIEITIPAASQRSGQLVIETGTGQRVKLRDAMYGSEGANDLREMLWPAMLLDETP
jgi:hypothetical protein